MMELIKLKYMMSVEKVLSIRWRRPRLTDKYLNYKKIAVRRGRLQREFGIIYEFFNRN